MLRIAINYLRPGMMLGRDIYGIDSRIILAAGVTLTEKHIEHLKKWNVVSVHIKNPLIELPAVDNVIQETTRIKALKITQSTLDKTYKTGSFTHSDSTKEIVSSIINQVLEKRHALIHLAQIHRHHDDLLSHSINVCILSTLTAIALGVQERSQLTTITLGAMFHDIGLILVPKHILTKVEPLTPEEQDIFKSHTKLGFEILRKNRDIPLIVSHIAFQHHERFDGKGYPRKIASSDINNLAHIVSIASEYDNMVADRPGQKGLETHVAYETIVAGVNTMFEPIIAKAFLSRIALYPIGTMVKLTSGEIGAVTKTIPLIQHRPEIQVIIDSNKNFLDKPYTIDLASKESLTVFIESILNDAEALDLFVRLGNRG